MVHVKKKVCVCVYIYMEERNLESVSVYPQGLVRVPRWY